MKSAQVEIHWRNRFEMEREIGTTFILLRSYTCHLSGAFFLHVLSLSHILLIRFKEYMYAWRTRSNEGGSSLLEVSEVSVFLMHGVIDAPQMLLMSTAQQEVRYVHHFTGQTHLLWF